MAGSVAEERLREKAVAALRERWPAARIIHELQLEQGGIRIDLAAVTEDFIALVEIKSERDVLKRLPSQISRAMAVADEVRIVTVAKHLKGVTDIRSYRCDDGDDWRDAAEAARAIRGAVVMVERDDLGGILRQEESRWRKSVHNTPDPRARWDLLWAGEMRSAIGRHFGGAELRSNKMPRDGMMAVAVEHMTGRELRRAVCAQLRNRTFPRADPVASLA